MPALIDVTMISPTKAWAVGMNGLIIHTGNGGKTWSTQNSPTTSSLEVVRFITESTGWIGGDNGLLLSTSDGGMHWKTVNIPTSDNLYDVWFFNETHGIILGENTILQTVDTGKSWSSYGITDEFDSQSLNGFLFDTWSTGWVVGTEGFIGFSQDNKTWINQDSGTDKDLYAITVSYSTLWICGEDGIILSSNDEGTTWKQFQCMTYQDLRDIEFSSSDVGWIVSDVSILKTNDGGYSWYSVQIESDSTDPTNLVDIWLGNVFIIFLSSSAFSFAILTILAFIYPRRFFYGKPLQPPNSTIRSEHPPKRKMILYLAITSVIAGLIISLIMTIVHISSS